MRLLLPEMKCETLTRGLSWNSLACLGARGAGLVCGEQTDENKNLGLPRGFALAALRAGLLPDLWFEGLTAAGSSRQPLPGRESPPGLGSKTGCERSFWNSIYTLPLETMAVRRLGEQTKIDQF